MASITGLSSGEFTDIDVTYTISIDGDSGEVDQILSSDGTNTLWIDGGSIDREDLTAAAGGTISISGGGYDGQTAETIQTLKVPNTLTAGTNITYDVGTTFDGSAAVTIRATDTDTTYSAGDGIDLAGTTFSADIDEDTIDFDGSGIMEVIKVPNALTAGTNITGFTTFDGSAAVTINATDTNTTYSAGDGLDLTGTTFSTDLKSGSGLAITSTELDLVNIPNSALANDDITIGSTSIALGATSTSVAGITSLTMSDGATTTLTGSTYTNDPTTVTYLDLTSATNIVSPYFFHTTYDPAVADLDNLTTSYVALFSDSLTNTFIAKATTCCIELLTYNYSISGNRWLYLRLNDDYGDEWSVGNYGGGAGTGTRDTARLINWTDETDKLPVRQTWYLTGLTIGTSYVVNPMAKTSATTNYIYAGGAFPASILRGYYLPN